MKIKLILGTVVAISCLCLNFNVAYATEASKTDIINLLNQEKTFTNNATIVATNNDDTLTSYFSTHQPLNNGKKATRITGYYKLNDGREVIFTDGEIFFIKTIKKVDKPLDTNNINEMIATSSQWKTTDVFDASYDAKGGFGTTVFSIYTEGYFQYNGSSVIPHLINSWYTRGTLSTWQVENWDKGTYTYVDKSKAYTFARGNFHWGIEVKGTGFVVQDLYCVLHLRCTKTGSIDSTINVK